MASITLKDLAASQELDFEAMQSLRGAAGDGNWVLGAFPCYLPPALASGTSQVFNVCQQITNNNTYIDHLVNQTTTVDISNSGANSTNTAVLLGSLTDSSTKA